MKVRYIGRSTDRIQIQNLREKVEKMEVVIGELLIALKESNPELVLRHTQYVEKIKR